MRSAKQDIKNYFYILSTSVFTGLAGFVVIKLVQKKFGNDAFESFVLMLRYAGFIVPMLIVGMGVAVPRYAGLTVNSNQINERIVPTAVVAVLTTLFVFTMISMLFYGSIDTLLFGNKDFYKLAVFYYVASTCYALTYSILRGRERYWLASIIEVTTKVFLAIIFLYVFCLFWQYLVAISVSMVIISLFVVGNHIDFHSLRFDIEIIRYGRGRVLGDILYPMIFSMPILFSSNFLGVPYAVELSVLVMIMNVFLIPVAPVSTMLLPKVGQLFLMGTGKSTIRFRAILTFSMLAGVASIMAYYLLGTHLIRVFSYKVDDEFWVLGLALFFNAIYVVLRGLVDGLYKEPYLMKFLAVALFVEVGVLGLVQIKLLGQLALSFAIVVSMGLVVILILTLLFLRRHEWQARTDESAEI